MDLRAAVAVTMCAVAVAAVAQGPSTHQRLVCYHGGEDVAAAAWRRCSHVVVKKAEAARDRPRGGAKVLVSVDGFNEKLISHLKSSKVDGLDINLKKLDSKHDISDFVSTVRTKLGSDLTVALSVPPRSEILAKYYDFKALSKHVDLFILQTAFLGASRNVTFHPSRLSGLWDMQNTDSVVDLVSGLGAPLSKVVVAAPVQAFEFTLQHEEHTAPGSPALEVRSITRDELCKHMGSGGGNWTLERDQDQAGPYVFSGKRWIAFDDPTSIDIKAKYTRVRGLAGLALKDVSQDGGSSCGGSLLDAAHAGLSRQARAPRGAVLHSLEREILQTPSRPLDSVQVSPYRISRVIDVEGNVHVIRQDTRTEFECARQGYYVHPRSCGRFYRCVKFDQLSDEFNVFEFDCPAGLAFDSKFEVCVWPGSLSYSSPCSGSSEIAPVPRERFICPGEPGYYADPENCRWFFACLDHGKSPLSAYEFRCPFGLVFDEERLVCEWPWLVPKCASAGVLLEQKQEFVFGNGFKALEQYDGLGQLGVVKLGGLSGVFIPPASKIYSSAGHTGGAIYANTGKSYQSNVIGIDASKLGVSPDIAKAQEDARLLNEALADIQKGKVGITFAANVRPATGTVNIVGGGYSAVGVAASASDADFQISQDGSSRFDSVTAFPNSFAQVESIPVVSSVPLPSLASSSSSLESYNGGVIANIPQLQYRIESPSKIFFDGNVGSNLSNETLFVNYVSSTPAPFLKIGEKYEYANTAIPFVQNSGAKITVVSSTPTSTYVEGGLGKSVEGIIAQPVVPILKQNAPARPAVVSSYNYQQTSGDYKEADISSVRYSGEISTARPEVLVQQLVPSSFEQGKSEFGQKTKIVQNLPVVEQKVQPVVQYSYQNLGASAKSSGGSGYRYQEQTVVDSVPVIEQKVQTVTSAPVVQYSYQNTGATASGVGGYQYHGQQVATAAPNVGQNVQFVAQAPALQYHYQNINGKSSGVSGYRYQEQQAVVDNVPAIEQKVQTVTSAPVVQYGYQNAGATGSGLGGYQYHGQQQIVSEAPEVEQKVQFIAQAPIVRYNYQNVDAKSKTGGARGYQYLGQQVVTEIPVVGQQIQFALPAPAVQLNYQNSVAAAKANSYQYQQQKSRFGKVDGKVNFASGGSYEYKSPSYVAQERPKLVQPTVATVSQVNQVVHEVPASVSSLNVQQYDSTAESGSGSQHFNYSFVSTTAPTLQPVVLSTYAPSTAKPLVAVEPALINVQQPAVIGYSYENTGHSQVKSQSEGLIYSKPGVKYEGASISYSTPAPTVVTEVKPTVTVESYQNLDQSQKAEGYVYSKPAIAVKDIPVTYATSAPVPAEAEINRAVSYQQQDNTYSKLGRVEAAPITYATPAPALIADVEPAVFTYNYQQQGYAYSKPAVDVADASVTYSTPAPAAGAEVKPLVNSYSYQNIDHSQKQVQAEGYAYSKPAIKFEGASVTFSTPAPTLLSQPTPAVYQKEEQFEGYVYSKPSIRFEEIPVTYSTPAPAVTAKVEPVVTYSTPAPAVVVERKPVVQQKVTVQENYVYEKPNVIVETEQQTEGPTVVEGYSYPKPAIAFEEKPAVPIQQNVGYSYPKPTVVFEEKPAILEQKTYSYLKPSVVSTNTVAPSKNVIYEETKVVQPAVVTSYQYQKPVVKNYEYPKPVAVFSEAPAVPIYDNKEPVYEEPFVKKTAYITGSNYQKNIGDRYEYVVPNQQEYVVSSTPAAVAPKFSQSVDTSHSFYINYNAANAASANAAVASNAADYEDTYYSTPEPAVYYSSTPQPTTYTSSTPKPTFGSVIAKAAKIDENVKFYPSPQPDVKIYSTPATVVTQSPPISRYVFSSFDEQYRTTSKPFVTTSTYVPVARAKTYVATEAPKTTYLPVKTKASTATPVAKVKYVESYVAPELRSPFTTYLPAAAIPTQRPVLRDSQPKVTMIVKQNDFHPLLSAKLGAQCTCVSNTLKLKKPPPVIIDTTTENADEPFLVPLPDVPDDNDSIEIENYQYEPERVLQSTSAPQVTIKSTTNPIQPAPAPTFVVRKRVRVRPTTATYEQPTSRSVDVFLRPSEKSAEEYSDKELAATVRKGLNLIKSAAKEGTREALNSRAFDRYGPGGLRSRDETLQGVIDCQRAGLFRHPSECNKFYACRWDCTKKRFTLHVFNCPVHLTFDSSLGACNWPSQGPACLENTLLPSE